ncbi:MAG: serine/threonine protein kinase, partial [Candidatus Eremiobacteraeota bacterium]|nr:serine/threonine protein kinase [Candidatus Eremiobacteraeota bacterium]
KVLLPAHMNDPVLRARFLRECRIQGQLEHPAVVPVHDLGVGPDGAVYFTMKRVLGFTLDQIVAGLRRGDPELIRRFSRRRLLTAFLSICQAVELAHARGVIHRDLKPANMMLGDFGEVYVLDWGLARLASDPVSAVHEIRPVPPGESDHRLTAAGTFLGTPGYLPPEHARGEAIDPRADVYALG